MASFDEIEEFCAPFLSQIRTIHGTMEDLFNEVDTSNISPSEPIDYTIVGIEKVGEHLEHVIAIGDRIHEIASTSQKLLGRAQMFQSQIKNYHQDLYDEAVEKFSRSYGHLSWEERGSHYRLKTMDSLSFARDADKEIVEMDAIFRAIQSRLRVLLMAKDYYMMIVQIMRSSLRLEA